MLLCPILFTGQILWVDRLKWPGAEAYKNAPRQPIWENDKLEGYYKAYGNFRFFWINVAGHSVSIQKTKETPCIHANSLVIHRLGRKLYSCKCFFCRIVTNYHIGIAAVGFPLGHDPASSGFTVTIPCVFNVLIFRDYMLLRKLSCDITFWAQIVFLQVILLSFMP